jgi:hypothetical protein
MESSADQLVFLSVLGGLGAAAPSVRAAHVFAPAFPAACVPSSAGGGIAFLAASGLDGPPLRPLAWLVPLVRSGPEAACAVVPAAQSVYVNGHPVAAFKVLRAGDVFSLPGLDLDVLLARRYLAAATECPPAARELPCPFCGMPLKEAPVAACPCGVLFHCQPRPQGSTSDDILSCFEDARVCRSCSRELRLGVQHLPEPFELGLGERGDCGDRGQP